MTDKVTAYSFDNAVMTFGLWVEGQLSERDENFEPVHNLRELLGLETEQDLWARNTAMFQSFMAVTHGTV